ncbi:MAG: PAS domain-containing sensor histidine kinase [Candidatus Melainabacteria bacterium]|nr:PAS domain-containing sensor histidine kinase [Candidatus Melainabacteria bacterium]
MSLKISQKFLIAVSVPVIFELALVGTLVSLLGQADEARRKEQEAREMANRTYALMGLHVTRLTQIAIYKSVDNAEVRAQAAITAQKMRDEIAKIHALVARNPRCSATWQRLDGLVKEIGDEHEQALQKMRGGDKASAALAFMSMRRHFDELLQATDELSAQQAQIEGVDIAQYSELIKTVLYLSILLSVFTAFGLAYLFNRGTASRLSVIMKNTEMIAGGQAPVARLSGDDELARIDGLYHKMHESLAVLRRRERAILENVADVVCSVDKDLRFTDINAAAFKQWGFDAESFLGGRLVDLLAPNDRAEVHKNLRHVIERGKETNFECAVLKADGTLADTEWSVTYSAEEESLYCVIHDITSRKNLERMKAEFVAMVSHEIRTPLSSIQMTHSLIESELADSLDDFMTRSLGAAQDNINRLMALVNNLLDLDKLESGHIELLPENIAAAQIVSTAVNAVETLFLSKNIAVSHNIDSSLMVVADKERIVQVLINLLGNAVKYSAPHSKVSVRARKEGRFVRFMVTDSGRGIPEDKLQTVFERFRQVEASDEKVHKGAGLGLAISKAIIEKHNGKIGVDSTLGEGSTFWFTLPIGS